MASSSLQSPTFPLEIFHLILKNLAYSELNDDNIVLNAKVLRRCSLVCRAWVPICQAYLFKSAIVDSERTGPEKGIIQAIAAHPHIASYVQKIHYAAKGGVQVGHILDQNILTLWALPNLRSIYLYASAASGSLSCKFNQICTCDFVFSRLWVDCISSTLASVTDLTLHWVEDVPLVSLLSCPNLKSLSLIACDCVDWQTQPASTMVPMTSKIESLKLMSTTNVSYAFLGSIPHLKQLSVYEVEWSESIQPQFKDQLISTFRGLEKLTVDYHWIENPQLWVYLPLSMASGMGVKLFKHLQDLTVVLESEQEAAEIYQALRHAPSIRYLDISCEFTSETLLAKSIHQDVVIPVSRGSLIPYLNIHQFLPQDIGCFKTLHIRFNIEGFGEQKSIDTIEVLSKALSFIQSPASLEELVMTLSIDITQLLTLFGLIRQLKALDTALFVDSSMFPLLRWITFRIYVEHIETSSYPPKVDNKVQADLYHYIESSFPAFRRSSNSRINLKLWAEKDKADD